MQMERPDYRSLRETLEAMKNNGGFSALILANHEGILIESVVDPTINRDLVAAMTGYLVNTTERVKKELELGDINDILIRCADGMIAVKTISTHNGSLLLAALIPRHIRYYTRTVGKAATMIKKLLQ